MNNKKSNSLKKRIIKIPKNNNNQIHFEIFTIGDLKNMTK